MILTEIDNRLVDEAYKLEGYDTIVHKKFCSDDKTRLVALVKHAIRDDIQIREDFMIESYPNIWMQYTDNAKKNYLIGAFYRVWGKINIKKWPKLWVQLM